MPTYEYRCRSCGEQLERRRPMAEADEPVTCSDGHTDSVRLLSVFASVGSSGNDPSPPAAGPCGGACACYPG